MGRGKGKQAQSFTAGALLIAVRPVQKQQAQLPRIEAAETPTPSTRPATKPRPKTLARKSTTRRRPAPRIRPRLPFPRDETSPSRNAALDSSEDMQHDDEGDSKDQVRIDFNLG
jgi:hypothetical protein